MDVIYGIPVMSISGVDAAARGGGVLRLVLLLDGRDAERGGGAGPGMG